MLQDRKIAVVMPAYNSARTLLRTYEDVVSQEIVDVVIIVDDCSQDETCRIAHNLPKVCLRKHERNLGYGGNQKTCYQTALDLGADVVIMVHPDYQYTPLLIPAMAGMLAGQVYDCVLASRILCGNALRGGMPWWKYVSNRALTFAENVLLGAHLSEYHTGYRGFSRRLLEKIAFHRYSDGFIFDNEMLAEIVWAKFPIGEISCPTSYHPEASSIGFTTSVRYGFGCLATGAKFRLARCGIRSRLFPPPNSHAGTTAP